MGSFEASGAGLKFSVIASEAKQSMEAIHG
jgi:hypothetical protein